MPTASMAGVDKSSPVARSYVPAFELTLALFVQAVIKIVKNINTVNMEAILILIRFLSRSEIEKAYADTSLYLLTDADLIL